MKVEWESIEMESEFEFLIEHVIQLIDHHFCPCFLKPRLAAINYG